MLFVPRADPQREFLLFRAADIIQKIAPAIFWIDKGLFGCYKGKFVYRGNANMGR